MAERTLDEVIQSHQDILDRLQAPTPSVQPTWTPPPAPAPQYPSPQVLQQATQLSYLSMRMTPPPLSLGPSPGRTAMFSDPYEAAIQQQMSGQAGYLDPAGASSFMGRGMVRKWGERYGGVVGGVAGGLAGAGGGPAGMAGGASWGATIGGALGEYLPDIPLIGPLISGAVGMVNEGAAQQLSGMARLQQGTRGHVQMGQGQAGLGGTGMSGQAALDLTKQLQGMETDAFNVNDLINLTVTGAQTGMLMGAADISTIAERVKGLMRIVGEMARLTGDPDFRRNLEQISDLRRTGFSVEQAVGFIGELGMQGRVAGMAPGQLMQAGGVPGGQIFQQAGLAPAPGMQLGTANLAAARAGMGGLTPIQQGLFGGPEVMGQRQTQQQAQFMSQFMQPMLGALVRRGEGGEFELDPERIQQLPEQLAGGGFGEMMQRGGRFITQGGPGDIARFMRQMPELTSDFAQQYAGGVPALMTASAMGIGGRLGLEGKEALGAGFQVMAQGDPMMARQLELMATNVKAFEEGVKQQDEEAKREVTREAARRRDYQSGLERQIEAGERALGVAQGWGARGATRKAEEVAREQARVTAEEQGLQYLPSVRMPKVPPLPGAVLPGLELPTFDPETLRGIAGGVGFTEGERTVLGITGPTLPGTMPAGGAWGAMGRSFIPRPSREVHEERLTSIKETGKIIKRAGEQTPAAIVERRKQLEGFLEKRGISSTKIWAIKKAAIDAAAKKGRDDKGISKNELLTAMRGGLEDTGLSPGQAQGVIDAWGDDLAIVGVTAIEDDANPEGMLALLNSKTLEAKRSTADVDRGAKALERIQKEISGELGFREGVEMTEEQMGGLREFMEAETTERAAALAYLGTKGADLGRVTIAGEMLQEFTEEEQRVGRKLAEKIRGPAGEPTPGGIVMGKRLAEKFIPTTRGADVSPMGLEREMMEMEAGAGRGGTLATKIRQYLKVEEAIPKAAPTVETAGVTTPKGEEARERIEMTKGMLGAQKDFAEALNDGGTNIRAAGDAFLAAVSMFMKLKVKPQ